MGRRPYEDGITGLDVGHEDVLLGLVKTVDFVDEKYRTASVKDKAFLGGLDDAADIGDIVGGGVYPLES